MSFRIASRSTSPRGCDSLVLALVALAGGLAACGRSPLTEAAPIIDAAVPPPADACPDVGGTAPPAAAIPLGVYTACHAVVAAYGSTADGSGGTLVLSVRDGLLSVEVGKGVFAVRPGRLTFTPLTANVAVAVPGQTYGVVNVPCATSTIDFGALALEGDVLTVSLVGQGCQEAISGTLRCTAPVGATATLPPPGPPSSPGACEGQPPTFAVGTYGKCTTSLEGYGAGTVTVTQSQGVVTAALDGLTTVAPANTTLRFTPTTRTTATIAPGQTWVVSEPGAFQPFVSVPLAIGAGSIVVDGAMLFVFLGGTEGAEPTEVHKSFHCGAAN